MDRECLDCGAALRGRSDKKFCDDQCRSHYNNHLHSAQFKALKEINIILRKNYTVLSTLLKAQKSKIRKDELLKSGFNPDFHTHLHHTRNGNTYYFCYEYGVLRLEGDVFLVVKRAGG
ncbi:hypothetical protein [Daejeonella sp. H1SJ63]|uniref:hypothetical protein n=1 Tax=Daejeonella sp. H1SJ63 TaxID=3034145 RepID=UPI0023EAA876|nr:hypothetical protein [Daejeonella sp. H1SJ63]